MGDQEQVVTYSTVKVLQSASKSQKRLRPDGTRRPGKSAKKEFAVPWHRIAVSLGILSLLLLMTITMLVTMIFQLIQEKHQQQEISANLNQSEYLNEQLLANKTLECDVLRHRTLLQQKTPESFFSKKIECCTNPGKSYDGYWSCGGVNCYYFTEEKKNWQECKQTCQKYSSSLLKIDNEQEQTFITSHIHTNNYWIGLSYDKKEKKWKWIDNGFSPGMNFSIMNSPAIGQCAFLSSIRVDAFECSENYSCICERSIDCISPTSRCT
ncbi:killer cell lectin-like receptor 7 [Ochotona curzoniae]|uniref:killer cell lectin-like receptor 7 n=1 Tax=Ochotona curzoniae TaxID=130825 RepID=UPI001B34B3A9|nr:killer cell lectin-like receptor 7 [Ochotona curzoniae]XP_040834635.1 killer cell lectin-like receptor 7 [Ochotona curzoniae]